jgi:hypothetical protein
VRGDIYVHTVVIPEGYTMFDIAQAIEDAGLGSSQQFIQVARSEVGLISDLSPDAKSLEGYLFPNTYEFTRTQSMKDMAGAMVKQFRLVALQIGLTLDVQKTVNMASIIEKETAVPRSVRWWPVFITIAWGEHCAAGRSQRDLRRIARRKLRSALHPRRHAFLNLGATYTHTWGFRRDRSAIRDTILWKRPCIRQRRITIILSAMATATTAFPILRNTIKTSPTSAGGAEGK